LAQKVESAGFRILRLTSFVSLLLPLMFLSRNRYRVSARNFNPTVEFRMGRVLSRLLGAIMSMERWMIEKGVSFPAGGSLLLAAKRPGN
jgi:hypothetical protein